MYGRFPFRLRVSLILLLLAAAPVQWAHAGGDLAPLGSFEFWPWLESATTLGHAGAGGAWSLMPSAALINPATLLSFPQVALEVQYGAEWAQHPRNVAFLDGTNQRMRFFGLKLAGAGFGLELYRTTPHSADYRWTTSDRALFEDGNPAPETVALQSEWTAWGVIVAMRLNYDFVAGFLIERSTIRFTGRTQQQDPLGDRTWNLSMDTQTTDWTYAVGAQWDMTPDIQLGVVYRWNPNVELEFQVGEEPEGPSSATDPIPVRFGFPDVLILSTHLREGRTHLFIEGRRWKFGRLNQMPWLLTFVPDASLLGYRNQWDIRIGLMYELIVGETPVNIHLGAWNKPLLTPVWTGPEDHPLAGVLSQLFPQAARKWHGTAGLQIGVSRTLQVVVSGVLGPHLRAVQASLVTGF